MTRKHILPLTYAPKIPGVWRCEITANGTGGKVVPCPEIGQATIGCIVNLDNYEHLKLELTVPIDQLQQARAYLDQELGTYGRNHPETAERIDRYRMRVLRGAAA
jgi:hypothetical protein